MPSKSRVEVKPPSSSEEVVEYRIRTAKYPLGYTIYTSDDHMSEDDEVIYCLCNKPEYGLMIECQECWDWFHAGCVNISRGMIWDENPFYCPKCEDRTGKRTVRRLKCQVAGCTRPTATTSNELCIQHKYPLKLQPSSTPARDRNAHTSTSSRSGRSTEPSQQTAGLRTGIEPSQLSEDDVNRDVDLADARDLSQLVRDLERAELMGQRWKVGQEKEEADSWSPSVLQAPLAPELIATNSSATKMHTLGQRKASAAAHYTISRDVTWCHVDLASEFIDDKYGSDSEADDDVSGLINPD